MSKSLIPHPVETELDRLEGEIALRRESLIESLTELRDEVAELAQWQTWVRRRPLTAVGLGLLAGWTLGKLLRLR
ncbi:MAG: hypothetical protein KA712_13615 [Myxococcales bacterium]|nr:hypothetical protein [Myxococcales bacterium]